jgi:hypothetical protein
MNEEKFSNDWWLWRLYREAAEYINQPSDAGEQQIHRTLVEYREYCMQRDLGLQHQHWRVVDFG